MSKLLYHPPENPVAESPFDRAIVELAKGQDVKIVSPYISLSYLERIIGLSRSWQLISDVFEWLSATPDRERSAVYEFLKRNEGSVHYYPAIHAKTVISQTAAYTGSANLTDAGVLRRTEFGVLLRDKAQVDEIHRWFAALWAQTSPPALDRVQELVANLNQLANSHFAGLDFRDTRLESSALRVRARLVQLMGEHPISLTTLQGARALHAAQTTQSNAVSETPAARPTPLLLEVAPTTDAIKPPMVTQNQEPLDLDGAVLAYVERNASIGFTLENLHHDLTLRNSKLRLRESYFAIALYCASIARSLLELDAVNRLVYRDGRFVQSSRTYLEEALAPLDVLLEWLFCQLSFSESLPLPGAYPAQLQLDVPQATYRLLLKELEAADFLHAGQEGVQLNPAAMWSARLRLLNRAYLAWCAELTNYQLRTTVKLTSASVNTDQQEPFFNSAENDCGAVGVQSVTTETDAHVGEIADRLMEEELRQLKNKRILQQEKTLTNLDIAFEHLAQLYIKYGETVEMSFDVLKDSISALASLTPREAEKVLNGTSSLIQSPFIAVPAASKKAQVKLYFIQERNTELHCLPKTKALLESSKSLMAHARPNTVQRVSPKKKQLVKFSQAEADEASALTAEMADKYYRIFCESIFNAATIHLRSFNMLKFLSFIVSKNDLSAKVLQRLIYGHGPEELKMFKMTNKNSVWTSTYENLHQFPITKNYLEINVWNSSKKHYLFPRPMAAEKNHLTMHGPAPKIFYEDNFGLTYEEINDYMLRMVVWISLKSSFNAKYKNIYIITQAISQGTGIPQSVVRSLTKPTSTEKKLALMFNYCRGDLIIELHYSVMRRYSLAMAYLEKHVWTQSPVHKWLTPVDVSLDTITLKSSPSHE